MNAVMGQGPRPRVTLFVLAYAQEAQVAAAIAGAFAQTGDETGAPIEICSPTMPVRTAPLR